jgi:hypothetical protein
MARPLRIEYEGAVYHVTSQGLMDYIKGYRDIKEIPKSQRYISRPGLDVLFSEDVKENRTKRKKKAMETVERYGYNQKEVADYLGIHYSVISKLIKR